MSQIGIPLYCDGIRSGAELMLACLVFVAHTRGTIFAHQLVAASEDRAHRVRIAEIVDAAVRRQMMKEAHQLDAGPDIEIGVDLVRLAGDLIEVLR